MADSQKVFECIVSMSSIHQVTTSTAQSWLNSSSAPRQQQASNRGLHGPRNAIRSRPAVKARTDPKPDTHDDSEGETRSIGPARRPESAMETWVRNPKTAKVMGLPPASVGAKIDPKADSSGWPESENRALIPTEGRKDTV